MYKQALLSTLISVALSGCASHSHELKAAPVSTAGYENMACNDLHAEAKGSITQTLELTQVLDKKADDDSSQMAIGMILFWPALFALEGGDGEEAATYSRLKGEINAIEKVAIKTSCEPAQLAVKDEAVQIRLMREALKPVVMG